jgi:hypothetical protein
LLPEGITLRLYGRPASQDVEAWPVLFESSKKWLHPLFELQEFLASHPEIARERLFLRDRIIGLAAAHLILSMQIRQVRTDLASRPAIALLQAQGVTIEAGQAVDAISCITEALLKGKTDPQEILQLLAERRAQSLARLQNPS